MAVLHDLRLDLGDGRVAQIDHLLIHRTRRFYVLETKHFSRSVKITDEGEFLRWNSFRKNWDSTPSPLAQNERHVQVLRKVLGTLGLGNCPIESWVLVAPTARIERPRRFDTSHVMRTDQFIERLNKSLENAPALGVLGGLLNTGLHDSIGDIARKLVALHSPSTTDYMARFGLAREAKTAGARASAPAVAAEARAVVLTADDQAGEPEAQDDVVALPEPSTAASAPGTAPSCSACRSTALSIQPGRFGYYFACAGCGHTTPIELKCGRAGHDEGLRKDGMRFYRECAACGSSAPYFTNPG